MINKVILIGNLGQDPVMKYTQTGVPVVTFSVATSERWKDTAGEVKEQTEWHRIVSFKRLAEICNEYLHKGSKVYIEGKLKTRSWEQDGVKKYTTEIVAREMTMLDPKDPSASQTSGICNEPPLSKPSVSESKTFDDEPPF